MTALNTIREKRTARVARAKAILDKAEVEARDLDDAERAEFDAIKAEVADLDARVERAEQLATWERRAASPGGSPLRPADLRGYSVTKALREGMAGSLSGLEGEVHAELGRGREARGVMVPVAELLEQRTLTTGGSAGNLVATELAQMTDRRRPSLLIEALGATVLRGLRGDLDLPRLIGSGTAGWVAENGPATGSDATFAKKTMGPKTVAAEYEVSRRMLLQSNEALEPMLRADLGFLLSQALDSAAIRGGGANQPVGILSDVAVSEVTYSTLDWPSLASDMIGALDVDNVTGTRAFLTHPRVMTDVRKLKDGQGRLIPAAETFHQERVETTTQVPTNLGTAPDNNKAGLIYGEWASLYLGYWSGVDILMNPYHSDVAGRGGAKLHAFLDCDVLVRHPEGFRWAKV